MQAFVRLPTEFDNLLVNAVGYFDISPNGDLMALHSVSIIQMATDDKSWNRFVIVPTIY